MKIQIDGLNQEQVQMLDRIWACDTQEDLTSFFSTLTPHEYAMARTLQEMILDTILEDGWTEDNTYMAKNMLRNIGVKC